MKYWPLFAFLLLANAGCGTSPVTSGEIDNVAQSIDYGDSASSTLATKAWKALEANDDAAALAYTRKCVELYGEEGKRMNAELTMFAPVERVNNYWALNDAGTCTYIMATIYEKRRMYPEAAQAFKRLAEDFRFAQCWDPKGWYWHPADGATAKAKKYASK